MTSWGPAPDPSSPCVVWSCPFGGNLSRDGARGIHHRLGSPLWCAAACHLRQRGAIHIQHVDLLVWRSTGRAHHNHSLPPPSNGMVEWLHLQIKDALHARGAATEWVDHLPWVLLGLRASPKEDSGISTAETILGQQLVGLPVAHVPPSVIPAIRRSYAEVAASPTSPLNSAEWVHLREGAFGRQLPGTLPRSGEGTEDF